MKEIKVGDRVTRKAVNAFRYMQGTYGTVIKKTEDGRNKIKWDEKCKTGQQHSTIDSKFLITQEEMDQEIVITFKHEHNGVIVYEVMQFHKHPSEWERQNETIKQRLLQRLEKDGINILESKKSNNSPHIKIVTDKDVRTYILNGTHISNLERYKAGKL